MVVLEAAVLWLSTKLGVYNLTATPFSIEEDSFLQYKACINQKYPKNVKKEKIKKSPPPMYPIVFSETYCEAIAPLTTAMKVAPMCARVAPTATPAKESL